VSAKRQRQEEISGKREDIDRTGESASVNELEDNGADYPIEGQRIPITNCGNQKLVPDQTAVSPASMRHPAPAKAHPIARDETRVNKPEQINGKQAEDTLRQSDPEQNRTCLQRKISLDRSQIAWDYYYSCQHDEAKENQDGTEQQCVPSYEKREIDKRVRRAPPLHQPSKQQAHSSCDECKHRAGVQPIQSLALIERDIEESEAQAGVEKPSPVGMRLSCFWPG
jgi:hypothetical protein